MKKNRNVLRKVIIGISTLICCSIIVAVSVLVATRNRIDPVNPDDNTNLNYDLTQNNIAIDYMDFELWPHPTVAQPTEVIFRGLKSKPSATADNQQNVLVIPSIYEYNGNYLPVTRIEPMRIDVDPNKSYPEDIPTKATYPTKRVDDIIAVKIPSTVKYIEEASFFGYAKLEYFESPLVGRYVNSTKNTDPEKTDMDMAFASMFSTNQKDDMFNGLNDPHVNQDKTITSVDSQLFGYYANESDTSILSVKVLWYDIIGENQDEYGAVDYYLPPNLKFIKINNETGLCNRAFSSIQSVEKIVLSDTLVNMAGKYIFTNCTNLVEVHLPTRISYLGVGMFSECPKLKYISAGSNPESVASDGTTVSRTTDEVVINKLPANLIEIPSGMFYKCDSLEEIALPSVLENINSGAFYKCPNLKKISVYNPGISDDTSDDKYVSGKIDGFNLPANLKMIGASAFRECNNFTKVVIPTEVHTIGRAAFGGCFDITELTLPFIGGKNGNQNTKDSVFGWVFGTGAEAYSVGSNNYDNGETPNTTVTTGLSITQYYSQTDANACITYRVPGKLSRLIVSNPEVISTGALQGLSSLVTLEIGGSTQTIRPGALNGLASLEELVTSVAYSRNQNGTINASLATLFGNRGLTNDFMVISGNNVPKSLKKVVITSQGTIYTGTFRDFSQITDVTIGEKTTNMEEQIFHNCGSLTNLSLPFVGCFRGTPYYNYYTHGTTYYYWTYSYGPARYMRYSMAHIFSQTDSTSEEYRMGYSNWGGWYTRYIPSSLKTIEITDDTSIHYSAFRYMRSLTSVKIKNSQMANIEEGIFTGCYNLEEIEVPFIGQDYNVYGKSEDRYTIGWLFNNDPIESALGVPYTYQVSQYHVSSLPISLKYIRIGNKATHVGNYAFANCKYVETIDFDNNEDTGARIQTLGAYAFYNCVNLAYLHATEACYTAVGNYAFYNCKMVSDVTKFLPRTVTSLGDYSFALTSVKDIKLFSNEVGNEYSYTYIGTGAFSSCYRIETIEVPDTVEYIGPYVFSDCVKLTSVKLAEGAVSDYMFKGCTSLTTCNLIGVTNVIPEGMFYGCSSISVYDSVANENGGVKLDGGTTTIGAYAFANCYSIEIFMIPNTVTSIGTYALSNTGLKNLTIPKNVTTIGSHLCHGNDEKFEFWVYYVDSEWPSGWAAEWNCKFPVYVVGDISEDLFTYRYDYDYKAFIITGLEATSVLGDYLKLPRTYRGLPVVGIENSNGTKYVNSQKELDTIVIPSNYVLIGEDVFRIGYDPKPMDGVTEEVLKEVFVYFEETEQKVNEKLVDENKELYATTDNWSKWLPLGMVFTSEYWQYNSSVDNVYPHIKMDTFDVTLFTENVYPEYDGRVKTMDIKNIDIPGLGYGYDEDYPNLLKGINPDDINSDGTLKYAEILSMFTISYKDNILASNNAQHILTVNANGLNNMNSLRDSKNVPALRFINSNVVKFTINKKRLVIYPPAETENFGTKVYDEVEWTHSDWGTANVEGIDESFTVTGRLATKSANAGEYIAEYDWLENKYVDGRNDFRWDSDYHVYCNGRNVTDNFDIIIGQLRVVIERMDVVVQFTGGRYLLDSEYDANNVSYNATVRSEIETNADGSPKTNNIVDTVYAYGYQGEPIVPEVAVYTFDDFGKPTILVNSVTATVKSLSGTTWYSGINFQKSGTTPYAANITLNSNKNHRLVMYSADRGKEELVIKNSTFDKSQSNTFTLEKEYRTVKHYYVIEKGKVNVVINKEWTIGINDDYWSMDPIAWEGLKGQFGLGPNSYIYGFLRSDGGAMDTTYVYNTVNSGVNSSMHWDWDCIDGNKPVNAGNFVIYNKNNTDVDETDCYDVTFQISVKILYNKFDVKYVIKDHNMVDQVYPPTIGTDGGGALVHKIRFASGGAPNVFFARVDNPELEKDNLYAVKYSYGSTQTYVEDPLTITLIGTHEVHVLVERKNFYSYDYNVHIEFARKDVVLNPTLNKVYDGEAYDPDGIVLEKAHNQSVTLIYYSEYFGDGHPNNVVLAKPPVYVGQYYIEIIVQYPGAYGIDCPNNSLPKDCYFNNYRKVHAFEITKRQVIIDLNGSKEYDGTKVTFDLNLLPSVQAAAVPGDVISGKLVSVSSDPGSYYDSMSRWYWANPFAVFSSDIVKHPPMGDVTNNYEYVLINAYDIEYKQFIITWEGLTTTYDGLEHMPKFHIDNSMPIPDVNIKFYYGSVMREYKTDACTMNDYDSFKFKDAGEYSVRVVVTAPYYETYDETIIVVINPALLKYQLLSGYTVTNDGVSTMDPVFTGSPGTIVLDKVFYTELFYTLRLEVLTSAPLDTRFAEIYYSWPGSNGFTLTEPSINEVGVHDIEYKIVCPNFEDATGTIRLTISDENLKEIDFLEEIENVEGEYDWKTEKEYGITVNYIPGFNPSSLPYCLIYYSETGNDNDWQTTNFGYSQVGEYTVYVKVLAYGYIPTVYQATVTVTAIDIEYEDIEVIDYSGYYDADAHTVEVLGLNPEDLKTTFKNIKDEYLSNIEIWYTTNRMSWEYHGSADWSKELPAFTDVGTYKIYIKITAKNYNDLYLPEYTDNPATDLVGDVEILQVTLYGVIEHKYNQIEYSAVGLTANDIKFVSAADMVGTDLVVRVGADGESIETIHDGQKMAFFYYAYKDASGDFHNDMMQQFAGPTELGYYYVELTYIQTANCKRMTVTGYIEIVPRKLTITYQDTYEYNGEIHIPEVTIGNLVGSDEVRIEFSPVGFDIDDTREVGTYVWEINLAGSTDVLLNYVLPTNEITINVVKRKIVITFEGLYVPYIEDLTPFTYNTLDFFADVLALDALYDTYDTDPGFNSEEDIFVTGSALISTKHHHKMKLELSTKFGFLGDYGIGDNHSITNRLYAEYNIFDEDGNNVTDKYYEIIVEGYITIGKTPIVVDLYDYTVQYYDGRPHYIYEDVGGLESILAAQNVPYDMIGYSTDINASMEAWDSTPMKYTDAGEYGLVIFIYDIGRPIFKQSVKFTIEPATLVVEVEEPIYKDDCYDGLEHNISYSVKAKSVTPGETYEIAGFGPTPSNPDKDVPYIRYYKTSLYDKEELEAFYTKENFSVNDPLFLEGLESYKDAGEYYAMIYFPYTGNYYESLTTYTFMYEYRELHVHIPNTTETNYSLYHHKYDGTKYRIPLSNAEFETSDLLPGHHIDENVAVIVQTISANANSTDPTAPEDERFYMGHKGFEFAQMTINEDITGDNVAFNYKPVIEWVRVFIEKAELKGGASIYIQDTNFVKDYDGLPNLPPVFSLSDGQYRYKYYEIIKNDDGIEEAIAIDGIPTKVGKFKVVVRQEEGTNYKQYPASGDFGDSELIGYVTCNPRKAEITWNNLTQEFANKPLCPTATIEDVYGNVHEVTLDILTTRYTEDGTPIFESSKTATLAGEYYVTASLPPSMASVAENYDIYYSPENYRQVFTITKKQYTISVSGDWYNSESPWSMKVSADMIDGIEELYTSRIDPTGQTVFGTIKFQYSPVVFSTNEDFGFLRTTSTNPGRYEGQGMFAWDLGIWSYELNSAGGVNVNTLLDITNSIEFIIDGYVTIYADDIRLETKPVKVEYNQMSHDLEDIGAIKVLHPSKGNYTIYYKEITNPETGEFKWTTTQPDIIEVGEYEIEIYITYGDKETYGLAKVTVKQAESFVGFTTNLNKVYNGVKVNAETLKTSITGNWNGGSVEDLVFKFYNQDDALLDAEAGEYPINAGNYKLIITCKKDYKYDESGNIIDKIQGNCTTLYEEYSFTISPKTINLDVTEDLLVFNEYAFNVSGGLSHQIGYLDVTNHPDLISGDILRYAIIAEGIQHGVVDIETMLSDPDGTHVDTTNEMRRLYNYDIYNNLNGYSIKLSSSIYRNGDFVIYTTSNPTDPNPVEYQIYNDYTGNYQIRLNFEFDVHYERMEVTVGDIKFDYDGNAHSTIIDETYEIQLPKDRENGVYEEQQYTGSGTEFTEVIMEFSKNGSTSSYEASDITQVYPTKGVVIFYRVVQKKPISVNERQYEDFYGSYKIVINYLKRTIENVVFIEDAAGNPTTEKVYDGNVAGNKVTRDTTDVYLPLSMDIIRGKFTDGTTLPDFTDENIYRFKATVSYYKTGSGNAVDRILDSGVYYYTIYIPASDYYDETIHTGVVPITVNKAVIYMEDIVSGDYIGRYSQSYNSLKAEYIVDVVDSPYKIYTKDSVGNEIIFNTSNQNSTKDLEIYGTLTTSGSNVGIYSGNGSNAKGNYVQWKKANYSIYIDGESQTKNYRLDISNVTMEITEGTIEYETKYYEVDYFGGYYYPTATNIASGLPSSDTAKYLPSVIYTNPAVVNRIEYANPLPDGGPGEFSTTPIGFQAVSENTYEIYIKLIANNFKDLIVPVVIKINKAKTYIRNINKLSKVYDALEVLYPTLIDPSTGKIDPKYTNNTEVDYSKIIFTYNQRNADGTDWVPFAGNGRPRDVGVYQLVVEVPSTPNFEGNQEVFEFTISGYVTDVIWSKKAYTYDATKQTPIAYVPTLNDDKLTLVYNYTHLKNDGTRVDMGSNVPYEAGTYIVVVSIDGDTNYLIDEAQMSCAYIIEKRNVFIELKANKYVNSGGHLFSYNPGTEGDSSTYSLINKVNGHKSENSFLRTSYGDVGILTDISSFEWVDSNMNKRDNIEITDYDGKNVTHNYNIMYDIELFITWSEVEFKVEGYMGEWDGLEHGVKVIVDSISGDIYTSNYEIRYSRTSSNNPDDYRTEPYLFSDVGVYPVYVCVLREIYDETLDAYVMRPGFGGAEVIITQIDSKLELVNPNTNLNKVYDGVAVVNPEITYGGMDKDPNMELISFDYYEVDEYGNETPMNHNPYEVGNYKLYIRLSTEGKGNYSDDELPIPFAITKRTLVISRESASKQYSTDDYGWKWEVPNDYVMPNATKYQGLAPNEQIFGTVQLKTINVGSYKAQSDFGWVNVEPVIKNAITGMETQNNYDVIFDLHVQITPGKIVYSCASTIFKYSGAPRSIYLEVFAPLIDYTIEYRTNSTEPWSSVKPHRTDVGTTPVYFRITAPNYESVEEYSCAVTIEGGTRLEPEVGETTKLADLDVFLDGNETALDPKFNSDNLGVYKIENVDPSTSEIKFECKTANPLSTVEGYANETYFEINNPYALDLATFDTYLFKIVVTDFEGDQKIYQVMISTHSITLDTDNEITNIELYDGTDTAHSTDLLEPYFDKDYHGPYTIIVTSDVESVDVNVTAPALSSVTINGASATFKNIVLSKTKYTKIIIECAAQDGTKASPYVINVGYEDTPPGSEDEDDNDLFSLQVSIDGVYQSTEPMFDPATTGIYRIENVSASSSVVKLEAIANSSLATIDYSSTTCNENLLVPGEFDLDFLTFEINKFEITVTSGDGNSSKVYTVWISTGEMDDIDDNNAITDIKVFDSVNDTSHTYNYFTEYSQSNYGVYTIYVPQEVNSVDVVIETSNPNASALVNNKSALEKAGHTGLHALIALVPDIATIVTIQCTATDGTQGNVYTLNIVREGDIDDVVVNEGGVVYIQQFTYCGKPYMLSQDPYFEGVPMSEQSIRYFNGNDMTLSSPISKPTEVGTYKFELKLAETAEYKEETIVLTFHIVPRKMDVVWENLEFTYDGNVHIPTAYFVALDNQKVSLTVTEGQVGVGTYTAKAEMPISSAYSKNYTLNTETINESWDIIPKPIEMPLIREDISIVYGDEMKVIDNLGYEYHLDEDGKILYLTLIDEVLTVDDETGEVQEPTKYYLDKDGNIKKETEIPALERAKWEYLIHIDEDTNANGVVTKDTTNYRHIITVELIDKVNTIWGVGGVSKETTDDLEFGYDITPLVLTKDNVRINVGNEYTYTGVEIVPDITVQYHTKDNVNDVIHDFILSTSAEVKPEVDIVFADNVEIGYATITATAKGYVPKTLDNNGITYTYYDGNYSFEIQTQFEIVAAPATFIKLKPGATIGFMEVLYDAENGVFTINDGTDGAVERTEPYKVNTYLGRLYQDQYVQSIIDQIGNDVTHIAVYDNKGNIIKSSDWSAYKFGTGWKIELYDDVCDANDDGVIDTGAKKIDEIEGILFGDTDGSGDITGNDVTNIALYLNGSSDASFETLGSLFVGYLTGAKYTAVTGNDITNLALYLSGTDPDFNINYKPISE